MAQDGRAGSSGLIVIGLEQASGRDTRAEARQEVRRDADASDALGIGAVAGEVVVGADRDRDILERGRSLLDVEKSNSNDTI